jgi:16S rRNA (guanine(527)-N(7))-methyltransferase RsmG
MSTALVKLWGQFKEDNQLTHLQVAQFETYYGILRDWNELFNLTTLTELPEVLSYHFSDSLMLEKYKDLSNLQTIGDIGTGPGFPALPLKIKYPHLKLVLIEVSHKKIEFLKAVVTSLGLTNVEISDLDWRTFLRKTVYPIEVFCARASLQPEELVRMFQSSSPYKNSELVYWASHLWLATKNEEPFITKIEPYEIDIKKRKLVFMKGKNS